MAARSGRDEAVQAVTEVFRCKGYDGASLSDLATETGLGRSSLYHYFPGGKSDMALAALGDIQAWQVETAAVLEAMPEAGQVWKTLATALDDFYHGGRQPCLLGSFAVGVAQAHHAAALSLAMAGQVALFARVARAAGRSEAEARCQGEDAAARLQGALILTRLLDDPGVFRRALADIGSNLTAP